MSTPGTGAAPAASRPRLAPICGSLARPGVSRRAPGPGALPSLPRAREPKRGAVLAEGSAPSARAAPSALRSRRAVLLRFLCFSWERH